MLLNLKNRQKKRYLAIDFPHYFTQFRIEDAQSASPSPLITARFTGVLNEKMCNK